MGSPIPIAWRCWKEYAPVNRSLQLGRRACARALRFESWARRLSRRPFWRNLHNRGERQADAVGAELQAERQPEPREAGKVVGGGAGAAAR